MALILQLPFSIRKDIRRRKELRYGRRLKGPILVSPRQFAKAVTGDGIGITTNDDSRPLRVPRNAENKHFLAVGDTGSGKSSIIRQMLYQVADRGDSAIVYDPACEFVKQFYDERRGDIVLNPLDDRVPYWNPSDELRRKAEAKALAVSLYQPEGVTNRFFVEAPQKIFAHLMTYLPTPEQLVSWMSNPAEIDRRIKGTEYWMLIDTKDPHQRTGVLGSLNMSADSFRLLPSREDVPTTWTATRWAQTRQGWIFITTGTRNRDLSIRYWKDQRALWPPAAQQPPCHEQTPAGNVEDQTSGAGQIGRRDFADRYFAEDKPDPMNAVDERFRMEPFSSGAYRPLTSPDLPDVRFASA